MDDAASKKQGEEMTDESQITKSLEGSESDLEEGNFVVEKILKHRLKANKVEYFLKWKEYPDSENTWESEENILDKKLIDDYWVNPVYLGGRYGPTKQPRVEKTIVTINYEKLSLPSWEDDVDRVETITKDEKGELVVFLIWKEGPRTCHPTSEANLKCPQKMISFYESCVKFVQNPFS
ncbi:Chromobox protein 3 [Entomophthora muscae]|uniref:Chromobox protein 3 n=1 Tax=Entomophthora muscae TaxID=34485 RepID=A0ACC2S8W0_9FUNG|nr:Chromobox protein 3 [Entomophthora muscae]